MASASSAAASSGAPPPGVGGVGGGGGRASKRASPDPRGPVLELLQAFGVRDRGGYYDNKVRGKVLRMENLRALGSAPSGGKGSGRGPKADGYGGGRHRKALDQRGDAAPAAAAAGAAGAGNKKSGLVATQKEQWDGLRYEDFEPLRELWKAYLDDLQPGPGAALAEVLAAADMHGATIGVVQARNPGCVRLRGTVLEETQRTFRIITADSRVRVLPKEACVFEVEVRGERLRLLGPAWSHRLPGGVPGPHAPLHWTLSAAAARKTASRH